MNSLNTKLKKRQRHCFVPGCTSGYITNKQKVTLFSTPHNLNLQKHWDAAIPRQDKQLDTNCVVCELHFDNRFIERNFKHTINGKEILIPRERSKLRFDAIPTIFPNLPNYLSKNLPKERNNNLQRRVQNKQPAKRIKLSSSVEDEDCIIPNLHVQKDYLMSEICKIKLPSEFWTHIQYKETPNFTSFATWNTYRSDFLQPDKVITVEESELGISCAVYINGALIKSYKSLKTCKDLQNIIEECEKTYHCQGSGNSTEFLKIRLNCIKNLKINGNLLKHKDCTGKVDSPKSSCLKCKYMRKYLLSRRSKSLICSLIYKVRYKCKQKLKVCKKRKVLGLQGKVQMLQKHIVKIKEKNKIILQKYMNNKIKSLSHSQQLAVNTCFKAAARKSTKGMIFEKEWMLEAVIMRMKSPRLYEHIRLNKILILPSRACLQKSLSAYRSGFGFNEKSFEVIKAKSRVLDIFKRHGTLLFDEIKLSENLQLKANGTIQGFVDYGTYTPEDMKNHYANHGLLIVFQPFVGDWLQIIGVFATRGNMKSKMLAKVLLDAMIHCENAGLFVDALIGDGASWNRSMWREFGIGVSSQGSDVQYKVKHPCDESRYIHFVSDFPHLLKCLRNGFLKSGFRTHEGDVRSEFVKEAWKQDQKTACLQAMPNITKVHLFPNNFEKMRVNYAFQLFNLEVLKGLSLYKEHVSEFGDPKATISLIKKMNSLITIMTSRSYEQGLRLNSSKQQFLKDFLKFLSDWRTVCGLNKLGFLSQSTNEGFMVTINSTLSLLQYLTKEVGFKYLLTSRLSQDKIENLFSIIRQSKGCNDHPTPTEFITIVECLSFYNLAHPPRGGNALPCVISSLIKPAPDTNVTNITEFHLQSAIDSLIEMGKLTDAAEILMKSPCTYDHNNIVVKRSDSRLIYYIAGYLVRKFLNKTLCKSCQDSLQANVKDRKYIAASSFTAEFDFGGLMYPSEALFQLIYNMENQFTSCFSTNELHSDSILDVISALSHSHLHHVGCSEHSGFLTQKIIRFFIMTRMHFYLKQSNKNITTKRNKLKYLKMRRCN